MPQKVIKIQEEIDRAVKIDGKRDYWLVRTEHGTYYETFKKNKFIALGWNDITVEEIKNSFDNEEHLRNRLAILSLKEETARAKAEQDEFNLNNVIDLKKRGGKQKASMIVNKLQNFYKLRKGDVIVIPSESSEQLSFGVIEDQGIYVDLNKSNDCDFRKRRKVKWIIHKDFEDLDTIFYMLKKSMHAISSIKFELAEHVDRVMNDMYFKEGNGYYVIRVKKKEDIKAEDLFELGNDLLKLLKIINNKYGYNEPVNETIVKINVQSDGDFVLIGKIGKGVITLGVVFNLVACSPDVKTDYNLSQEEIKIMQNLKKHADSLQIQINNQPL